MPLYYLYFHIFEKVFSLSSKNGNIFSSQGTFGTKYAESKK